MSEGESLRSCPQCSADIARMSKAMEDIAELSFCLKCHFPLQLIANKYRLQKMIGRGGFGEIYLAHHVNLPRDQERVVKVLKPEVFDHAGMVKRFEQEVHLTSLLSRQNNHIVRIYDDFGSVPRLGRFYVMEYLKGVPLTHLLENPNNLPPLPLCFHIFRQLCEAMEAAHRQGVVHRDIKPDNIFLVRHHNDPYFVKVIDFGIAKPLERWGERSLVATQGVLGTPLYMSPEQWDDVPVDHRTDIYAMGVVLYEMLTGRTPFWDRSAKRSPRGIMTDHLITPPPSLSEANPDRQIPTAIEQLVLRALSKDPEDRFDSVKTWRHEMEHAHVKARLWPAHGWREDFSPEDEWGPLQSYLRPPHSQSDSSVNGGFRWPRAHSDEWHRDRMASLGQWPEGMAFVDTSPADEGLRSPNAQRQTSPAAHFADGAVGSKATHERARMPDDFGRDGGPPPHMYPSQDVHFPSQEFQTHRSGAYDLKLLHPPDEVKDDFGDLDTASFQPSKTLFWGSAFVMSLVVLGTVWFTINLQKIRPAPHPQGSNKGVCGPTHSSWAPYALRVLVLPLTSKREQSRQDSKLLRHKRYMQRSLDNLLREMFRSMGALRHLFFSVKISEIGFVRSDPNENKTQARMYGTNCGADIVLSATWLTGPGGRPASNQNKNTLRTEQNFLRLFATYTGRPLSNNPKDPSAYSVTPKDLDELLQGEKRSELKRSQIRLLLHGLLWLRAAQFVEDSPPLQAYLWKRSQVSLSQLGLKLDSPPPQPNPKRKLLSREVFIPAGSFWLGPASSQREVELSSYRIDRYEVSREDYALCVLKGHCTAPMRRWMDPPWDYPRDRISPDKAQEYCAAFGKKLPTEEQWVKAARGGLMIGRRRNRMARRIYPWGNTEPTCKHANIKWCFKEKLERQTIPVPVPFHLKLLDRSPYGVYHLMGNVAEIIRDGSIKGGNGFADARVISWKEHMDQRNGLKWVGFRCVAE